MLELKIDVRKALGPVKKDVEKVLDQLERRGMKDALMKAATPMVKKTREGAPVRTGALKKSIGKKGKTYPKTQTAYVVVGPRSNFELNGERPAWYAHLVEFGHDLVFSSADGKRQAGFVAPRPFMRPAFEATKDQAFRIYGEELGNAIHRHFKRAKRSGRL